MLDPTTAREKCEQLAREASATRRYNDAMWTLGILYDSGKTQGFMP